MDNTIFLKSFYVWRCRGLIYTWFSLTDFLWVAPVTSFQLLYSFCYNSQPPPLMTSQRVSDVGIVTNWDLRLIRYSIKVLRSTFWPYWYITDIEKKRRFIPGWQPLLLIGWKVACKPPGFRFIQPGGETVTEAERESSGFSRQADRSDKASQKNRDLFAAHSIQSPPTLTFKFCLFISHPLLGFCPS